MFASIATAVNRLGGLVVAAWLAVALALTAIAPRWDAISRDDDVRFFPADYPTVIGQDLLEEAFPADSASSSLVIIADRFGGPLTPEDLAFVLRTSGALDREARSHEDWGLASVLNYRSPAIGPRLISPAPDPANPEDGQATLIVGALKSTYLSKRARLTIEAVHEWLIARRSEAPTGLRLALTGSAVVGHDMNRAAQESIDATTVATITLVVAILLMVYRSPVLAMVPLVTIAFSVYCSLKAIAALTLVPGLNFQVINITEIFVVVVLFGAGTDYCLFLISRYREELERGRNNADALDESLRRVGWALLASAGTVMCGLGLLTFSTFAKIQNTGPAIALSLAIALLAALTLAPVLLRWLGSAVFWPFKPPQPGQKPNRVEGFWGAVAGVVVRHPAAVLIGTLLVLAPLAVIGWRTTPSYNQLADLGPNAPSALGAKAVRRYFAIGELGPTALLIRHPELRFRSEQGRAALAALSDNLAALPGVNEVRSLTRPLGKPVAAPKPVSSLQSIFNRGTELVANAVTEGRYVAMQPEDPALRDHVTRLEIIFDVDPFSPAGLEVLGRVRGVIADALGPGGPLQGADRWGFTGATPAVEDLRRVTMADERRMYWMVTLGVYLILLALLRRPVVCLYLIVTVVLGYLAALGATELTFHYLVHEGPDPWYGLDWKVGFFLFVILIAVGEDYNIFVMSRIVEEQRERGTIEGIRHAVAVTGGIISSCGLIMAGTFAAMVTGHLMALKELGFALALGVLLDTFVVRPVLVPAFLVLWDRRRKEATAPIPEPEAAEVA